MAEFFSTNPAQVALAFALDLLLGDPRFLPHPARFTGWLVGPLERLSTRVLGRTVFSGMVFWCLVCGGQLVAVGTLSVFVPETVWWWIEVWIIYQCFAAMDMQRHVRAILIPLCSGDLPRARERLGWIVGRDTADLDPAEISRATVESVGESACDSMMAPLFWASVMGPFGALLYRATNTLDSMVGHHGERYGRFGRWSARADDVLNLIPARLVAVFSQPLRLFQIRKEAKAHRSPNAGWGEASIAYSLGVRLRGRNSYGGKVFDGPVFNAAGNVPDSRSVARSLVWWWRTTILGLLLAIGLSWIR